MSNSTYNFESIPHDNEPGIILFIILAVICVCVVGITVIESRRFDKLDE